MYINYYGEEAKVAFGQYPNGNTAISLIGEFGEPIATCSINLGELADDRAVAIKNYSENMYVEEALILGGVLGERIGEKIQGYLSVPVYNLSDKAYKELKQLKA